MQVAPRIVVDPRIRQGKPVVKGTRVPVELILTHLARGTSYEEIMDEYDLTRKDILAALHYAAKSLMHEEIRAAS